ncbi:hypothetical protein B0I35DRAFT_416535 [Stachybotrys elegans]|uniref:Uncharacterized protein n=1 Tax=Stachybotrys elegans TaxID=80388 RepID=A0A8K0T2C5_9HYPO|nr:hypothetical protein B0I35DRAFT_416535 [Stachybotrys elegans]
MKCFTLIATLLAASLAAADSCNRGGSYCGISLLRKGNYRDHVVETLQAVGQPTDEAHIQNSRFDCLEGGDIAWRQFCAAGCGGADSEDPDYCL